MADQRVHPAAVDSPPRSSTGEGLSDSPPKPAPKAQPTTYVVQLPREQILRYPPPENARKFEALSRGGSRRGCCRRCCCVTLCLLLLLIIAAGIAAGVMYLVFRFKSPEYTVTSLSVNGLELTSSMTVSPGFDVSISAKNPNGKMGIYYREGSAVTVFYEDVQLSDGVLPTFYQPKKNTTEIEITLTGSDVVLGSGVRTSLRNARSRGRVPFLVRVKAPVKLKVGLAKTWEITVKVKCDIILDALDETAQVVSSECDYSARLW